MMMMNDDNGRDERSVTDKIIGHGPQGQASKLPQHLKMLSGASLPLLAPVLVSCQRISTRLE